MGRPKLGPYAIFVREQRRCQPGWNNKSDPELFKLADPLWTKLNEEQRSVYIQKAKEYKETGSWSGSNNNNIPTKLGYDTLGRPLEEIAKRDQRIKDLALSKSDAIHDLVNRVEAGGGAALFTLIHVNIFVQTPDTNEFVPAEIALVKFSPDNGVVDHIQFFPKPGTIPAGYKYRCMETSELSHKIPMEVPSKDKDLEKTLTGADFVYMSDEVIISSVKKFLKGTEAVFCTEDLEESVQGVLDCITGRSGQPRMKLNILNLHELLHTLAGPGMVPSLTMAQLEFERERFQYHRGLSCEWHEEATDTNKCSLSFVHRWAFTILGFTNKKLGVDKVDGQHVPLGTLTSEEEKEIAANAWDDVEESEFSSRGNFSRKVTSTHGSTWGKEGSFASEDIRYRSNEPEVGKATSSMSALSLSVKDNAEERDFDSEYELPPSGSRSVSSYSLRSSPPGSPRSSIVSGKGRGALLQSIKNDRKSRMVANLKE